MSSLFTDTIRKTGGSLGTDIRIKNTSVYESDGGTSVTQNLVQGINKAWVNFNGTGTIATRDSFNVASLVDDSTGDYQINFTNSNDFFDSIEKTHLSVGKAVFTTSIAISLGFLTLCFSNFVPTIIFGLFTSLAMIFAMIGVLITLPSILNYLR